MSAHHDPFMQGPSTTAQDMEDPPSYADTSKHELVRTEPPPWKPNFTELPSTLANDPIPRRPLDPPPDCFSVPSPLRVKSHDFPPFAIPSITSTLADGFKLLYPSDPDLLTRHGITKEDWLRFLEDVVIAARLAGLGLSAVGSRVPVVPLPARGLFGGSRGTAGTAYDASFVRSPRDEVQALMQVWNEAALERRKLRVSLVTIVGGAMRSGYEILVESL